MNRNEILKVIYMQKDFPLAEKLCSSKTDNESLLMLARVLFFQKKYQRAEVLFKKLHRFTEYGYCKLFQHDKKSAELVWNSVSEPSPLLLWARALLGYIEKKQTKIPTFFQIRNFYESDLDTLISLKYSKWAENLINSIQFFADINPEVYKFTARVLLNHSFYELSEKFLNAGKDYFYNDTELHFIEAQLRLAQNKKVAAVQSLKTVLDISPSYYPAKKLLSNIK